VRFAGSEANGTIARARIQNLSATGIAFVVASQEAPQAGELLKIEFTLPTGRSAAWFATVVRVEHKSEWDPEIGDRDFTLIGVRFRHLPQDLATAIHRSLGPRANEDDASAVFNAGPDMLKEKKLAALYGVLLILCFALLALPPQAWLAPFHALLK
jgi:hypothetical protein